MNADKQLCNIQLAEVLEKRRLDQALNAKEFAVLAGISYSLARQWFRLPGFPVFRGVVFWQDFVQWRMDQNRRSLEPVQKSIVPRNDVSNLPPRASKILLEAH